MNGQSWRLRLLPARGDSQPHLPLPPPDPRTDGGAAPRPARPRLRLHLPRPRPSQWSRYTSSLLGVLGLGLLLRLPFLWAEPLDTPSAPQATMAAFVRRLIAHGGDLKTSLPWIGPLPLDLTAGLPLYAWSVALFSGGAGPQPWIGRVVSVVAALAATGLLFVVLRRLAGGRAAVYAALFLTLAPLGLYYGRAYLPDALGWTAAGGALAATLRWRDTLLADRPHKRRWAAMAAGCGGAALLVAPSNLALLPALLYLARPLPRSSLNPQSLLRSSRPTLLFLAACCAPLLLWQGLVRLGGNSVELDSAFGGGGLGAALAGLGHGAFYGLLAGRLVNNTLTFTGFLLLLAGLGRPARQPWPWVCHLWLLGSLAGVLLQGTRLAADDSTLAPLLPPLAALIGLGANWLATLPAVVVAALRGHEEAPGDLDADAADGTPPDEVGPAPWIEGRRPVRGAVRRTPSAASRQQASWPHTRSLLLRLGNAGTMLLLLAVFLGGWATLTDHYRVSDATARAADAGRRVAALRPAVAGGLVVAGSGAPEILYAAGRSGWVVPQDRFNRTTLDGIKAAGGNLLVTLDQSWLGRLPDYQGLVVSFQPFLFATPPPGFVVFDLRHAPATSDSRYFLESGHTLRGGFRAFWEANGGLARFGYPLTEEQAARNPDDGQTRTVQYFERALFELHSDAAGSRVQLAPLGRLLLTASAQRAEANGVKPTGLDPLPAAPDPSIPFFKETGHTLKGEFLRVWQAGGGLPIFGYPISEEFNEVSPSDGKVHIMQYFERARFEWHQEAAGTPQQVQLGLVGREWLDLAP